VVEASLKMLLLKSPAGLPDSARRECRALERVQLKIITLPQEENDIGVGGLGFDDSDRGGQEIVQVGRADYGLAETCDETDCIQFLDEIPLRAYEVVAKYVYLPRLLLALFVQLLKQKAQPSVSLFIAHDCLSLLVLHVNLPASEHYNFGSLTDRL
jgi:hypothetical protein